jgi:Flp pilus assembly protein TadD
MDGKQKIKSSKINRDKNWGTNEVKITIPNAISLDLTPLTSVKRLRSVNITGHQLQSIDFTPIVTQPYRYFTIHSSSITSLDLTPLTKGCNWLNFSILCSELQTIDLTPLTSSKKLEVFYIMSDKLQTIDLTPLTSCKKLEKISLYLRNLESLDIAPLAKCSRLQELNIHYTKFQSIDLSPLSRFALKALNLGHNEFQRIELPDFNRSRASFQRLILCNNDLQMLDVTPIFNCRNIEEVDLDGNDNLTSVGFLLREFDDEEIESLVKRELSSEFVVSLIDGHGQPDKIPDLLTLCKLIFVFWPSYGGEALFIRRTAGTKAVCSIIKVRNGPCTICNTTKPRYSKTIRIGEEWVCPRCLTSVYSCHQTEKSISFKIDPTRVDSIKHDSKPSTLLDSASTITAKQLTSSPKPHKPPREKPSKTDILDASQLKAKVRKMLGEGKFTASRDAALQATQLAPEDAETWKLLSLSYMALNDFIQGRDATKEWLRLEPENAQAWERLSMAYLSLKRWKKTAETARKALSITPTSSAWFYLGAALYQLKDYKEAIKALEQALVLDPEKKSAWTILGLAHKKLGDIKQAQECQKRADTLPPS